MPHNIDKLHLRIEQSAQLFGDANDESFAAELLRIIHNPGWTTPAEWALVHGYLDAIDAVVNQLVNLRQGLLVGARQVGVREQVNERQLVAN